MAATVTILDSWNAGGNRTEYLLNIALDNSYPTGGEALDVANNERFAWLHAQSGGTAATGGGRLYAFDVANQKLVVYVGDNDAGADGPFAEAANALDLSAVTSLQARALSD